MIDKKLRNKILGGERITSSEALELFSLDIVTLGALADRRRELACPGEEVGFILDRIINYTNVCDAKCGFCAFHSRAGLIDPYRLTDEEIFSKIEELIAAGGTQVMLQGGLHPELGLEYFIGLVSAVKEKFPSVYLHSFSPAEIVYAADKAGISVSMAVAELKKAGLDSVPGASDLLVDRVRREVSPNKLSTVEWRSVMIALRDNGMGSSATMTYGMGETIEERVEHLEFVRSVQDETGILRAFIPWSFSPRNTKLEGLTQATGADYLRIVAAARIYLDNIRYIQAGWLTEGLKLAQIALAMGANDMGGVLMEELVVRATGIETTAGIDEMLDVIRGAGMTPVLRDSEYRILKRY
jgi:cyclic dehypoxanthinyl futalosine synthase